MQDKKRVIIGTNLALVVVALFIGVICLSPAVISTSAKQDAYYHGDKSGNGVSLLINVYWGGEEVERMLDILDEYNAKATFFIGGSWADDNVGILKKIDEKGHEMGSHGYFHKDCATLTYEQTIEEITLSCRLIKLIADVDVTLFAPPSGAYNQTTVKACNDLNLKTILWSKDTIDWRDKSATLILKRATKDVTGGDFILMHPMAETVKALPQILKYYKECNLQTVTVTENLTNGG